MDIKSIKELVNLVEKSNIHELDIQEKDMQIRITKNSEVDQGLNQFQHIPVSVHQSPISVKSSQPVNNQNIEEVTLKTTESDNSVKIPSPMVGTFYRAASPDSAPFVKVGDTIEAGKVLCIIEAMKLMNEIEAEIPGKIIKILVENGESVEYSQPLFLVEKI